MTAIATDRERLIAAADISGWIVADFGYNFTKLIKGNVAVVLHWNTENGFQDLEGEAPSTNYDLTLLDVNDTVAYLRGDRQKDAAGARYFTVTSPSTALLSNYALNESDKNFLPVRRRRLSGREALVVRALTTEARNLAQQTESNSATTVETVFGTELHVTWKRES